MWKAVIIMNYVRISSFADVRQKTTHFLLENMSFVCLNFPLNILLIKFISILMK